MNVKIKLLHPNAKTPSQAYPGDAGFDIYCTDVKFVDNGKYGYLEYHTGLAFEFPSDYMMLAIPRSSISETGLIQANSVGLIDSNYRGELRWRFKYIPDTPKYKVGDRIGQIIFIKKPSVSFTVVDELSPSERGGSGFGSSGNV